MDTKRIKNAFEPFNGYPLVYVFPCQVTITYYVTFIKQLLWVARNNPVDATFTAAPEIKQIKKMKIYIKSFGRYQNFLVDPGLAEQES